MGWLRRVLRKLLRTETLLRIAAVSALLAIVLMVWSLFSPTVASIMVAMTIGQGLGTLSFLAYLLVLARDLRQALRHRTESADPPADDGA